MKLETNPLDVIPEGNKIIITADTMCLGYPYDVIQPAKEAGSFPVLTQEETRREKRGYREQVLSIHIVETIPGIYSPYVFKNIHGDTIRNLLRMSVASLNAFYYGNRYKPEWSVSVYYKDSSSVIDEAVKAIGKKARALYESRTERLHKYMDMFMNRTTYNMYRNNCMKAILEDLKEVSHEFHADQSAYFDEFLDENIALTCRTMTDNYLAAYYNGDVAGDVDTEG